ncbi:hypothetical protein [Paraburkholderia acidipaludis]|uniref:hypothetical protein n=1 Tax=Paraburkholderia acidipaludis TaxID=660537 RepID=UPI00048428B0|nr:hypothetical protein [Paraburkholderia acidipaludis]
MDSWLLDRKERVDEVETLCLRLFDAWCESRSLMPLTYLMHGWPMPHCCAGAMRHLYETITDLRHYHADWLDAHTSATLGELCECLGRLVDGEPAMSRLAGAPAA